MLQPCVSAVVEPLSVSLLQHLAEAAPPSGAERRRFYSRTTTEALKEARQHQRKGAHPYRVVLGEVRSTEGQRSA
jgi:hypothetical protein